MHFAKQLTQNIEIGCTRRSHLEKEVVPKIGGGSVRNKLWSRPLLAFEFSLPACVRTNADWLSLLEMWEITEQGTHTFEFYDWTDETGNTKIRVRFDSDFESDGLAAHLEKVGTLLIVEEPE